MADWIREHGVVMEMAGDRALIRVERHSTCGTCQVRTGCGNGMLADVLGRRKLTVTIHAPPSLKPGDAVMLGIRDDALVAGALVMYLLPLGGLVLLPLLARGLFSPLHELWLVAVGVMGLLVGLWLVRLWLQRQSRRLEPVFLGRVDVPARVRPTSG